MADAIPRLDDAGTDPRPRSQALWSSEELSLLFASMVTLYFELLIIRYLSSEIRVFTNLKNLPLVASFFGIGLGMLLGSPKRRLRTVFPAAAALLLFRPGLPRCCICRSRTCRGNTVSALLAG